MKIQPFITTEEVEAIGKQWRENIKGITNEEIMAFLDSAEKWWLQKIELSLFDQKERLIKEVAEVKSEAEKLYAQKETDGMLGAIAACEDILRRLQSV